MSDSINPDPTPTIHLPIDGTMVRFAFDRAVAADPEMDEALASFVDRVGPLRMDVAPARIDDDLTCVQLSELQLRPGARELFAMDPSLSVEQADRIADLYLMFEATARASDGPRIVANPDSLNAQVVRAVTHGGFSYMVLVPDDPHDMGEVLYVTNDGNQAGVDWLDFTFEFVIGVLAVVLGIGAASKAAGKLAKVLRTSDAFDRLKTLFKNSKKFAEALKKLRDVIPGGKKAGDIYDALKEVLSILWESVISPSTADIKNALKGLLSPFTIGFAILSWLARFLSGGAAIVAEIGILLGTLAVKILRPDQA